ncbi:MAG: signal peptidase II [Fidelibacterota bacterium]
MKILQVSAIVVILDQISKILTRSSLSLYESVPIIPKFFHLTYVTNDGMAFGINFPGGIYIFTGLSLLLSILLFWYLWIEKDGHIILRLSLSMILGGAIGNLIDRIIFGKVVDFLDFMIGDYHWYVFNIADSSVTVGMTIFLYYSFFIQPKLEAKTAS